MGEVAAKPTERAKWSKTCRNCPLTRYRGSSPKGRAFGRVRASSGVWALPEARVACNAVIKRRNWRKTKGEKKCEWDEALEYMVKELNQYLENGKYADLLKSKDGVGVGFVDGNIEILHTK